MMIGSLVFLVKNVNVDLARSLCACLPVAALVSALYSLMMAYMQREAIEETFNIFQKIYDSSII